MFEFLNNRGSIDKGFFVIEENIFVTEANNVIVKDAGIDSFWILLSEERVSLRDLVKTCDRLRGFKSLARMKVGGMNCRMTRKAVTSVHEKMKALISVVGTKAGVICGTFIGEGGAGF